MELHFLKSTWSDIIILKNGNDVAMIDTGFEKQFETIKEYLDKLGVRRIEFILLTHFHRDHYGSIPNIIKNYEVGKVYFKAYSALDKTTANGLPADEKYRLNEYNKFVDMQKMIKENSQLVKVEDINSIEFSGYELKLFNTRNSIEDIFNDKNYEDSYHKILYSENQNSLAALLKINHINIFFGGDVFDRKSNHPNANYINYQIASTINEEIDIYKVPHHGTVHCNSERALNIYKPKIAIITNGEEYLRKESTIYQDLMKANKYVKILLTENHNIIIKVSDDGRISYEEC